MSDYKTYLSQAKHHSLPAPHPMTEADWIEWNAAQKIEDTSEQGPQWGTFGDHDKGHEHAQSVRAADMRRMHKMDKLTAEQIAEKLKLPLEQVQEALKPKNDSMRVGEPLPNYSTENAHAPRAGDRERRRQIRDLKFSKRRQTVEA